MPRHRTWYQPSPWYSSHAQQRCQLPCWPFQPRQMTCVIGSVSNRCRKESRMVWLGPLGRIDDAGRSIVEVPRELTDDDLDWLNAHSCGVRVERAWPVVSIAPDPRLAQKALR